MTGMNGCNVHGDWGAVSSGKEARIEEEGGE